MEKLDILGGSFLVSGAFLATVDSEETKDVDDSLERILSFYQEQNETSVRQPDYDFTAATFSQTGKTIDFMTKVLGLEYTVADNGKYVGVQFTDSVALTRELMPLLEEKNVTVLTGTKAEEILTDGDSVTGLRVSNDSGEFHITADKVIIATGGASWNKTLMKEKEPVLDTVDLNEKASVGNTGDGMDMLEAIGAQRADTLYVKASKPDFADAFGYTWRNVPSLANNLVVDADGRRFANEGPWYAATLNTDMMRHGSSAYYAIFDTINTSETLLADLERLSEQDNAKIAVYAETIEDLAEKIDIDPEILRNTFERYQELCEAGSDEDFGKDASKMVAYSTEGGYYAAYQRPASYGSVGGIITDENWHVLRDDGSVIENVFAVGETATSKLFGDYYFGGFSLGLYAAAGRVAAETAVAELEN